MKVLYFLLLSLISLNTWGEPYSRVISTKQFRYIQLLLKNRYCSNLINYMIVSRDYESFLEIGVSEGTGLCSVTAKHKVATLTPDEFFKTNKEKFDIIFIHSLPLYEQVLKDLVNSLNCLNPDGIIVIHNCLPMLERWNSDVWRASAHIQVSFPNIHFCVLDIDGGCGLMEPDTAQSLYPPIPLERNIVKLEDWIHTFQ